jgi:hypothetical protein
MKKKNVLIVNFLGGCLGGCLGLLMFAGALPAMAENGSLPAEFAGRTAIVIIKNSNASSGFMACSAVVVRNASTLLTAGHCVEAYSTFEQIEITNPLNGRTISRGVTKRMHPQYHIGFRDHPDVREIGADLAALQLDRPLDFPIHPVRIATAPELGAISSPAPTILLAAGVDQFGHGGQVKAIDVQTGWYTSRAPGVLQSVPSVSDTGPCDQDSGGAIFYYNGREYLLMGIFSSRTSDLHCGEAGSMGYAAAITSSLGWL